MFFTFQPFYKNVAVGDKIYSFGGSNDSLIYVYIFHTGIILYFISSTFKLFFIHISDHQTETYQWSVMKNPSSASPQYNKIPGRRIGHTAVAYKDLVWKTRYIRFSYNIGQKFNLLSLFYP